MRKCEASARKVFIGTIAVYRGGDYAITFILTEDGILQLAEIALMPQEYLNIAVEYMLTE